MRRARPLVVGLLMGLAGYGPAFAEPDDTPWNVNDSDLSRPPSTIEEILARDRKNITEDNDIVPPGQNQPGLIRQSPADNADEDRLTPNLPNEIHSAGDRAPDGAIKAVDAPPPAGNTVSPPMPAPQTTGAIGDPRPAAATAAPSAATTAKPATGAETVAPSTPARAAIKPANAPPPATPAPAATERAQSAPASPARPAPARPPEVAAQTPTPAAIPSAPPAQATVAKDGYDPHAPPPLAVPSTPVTQPAVAVNGKLYLPLARYFATKGAVTLTDYDAGDREALLAHYDKTLGEAMWVGKDGFNAAGNAVIDELKKADDWGLSSADYKIPALTRISSGDFDFEDLADAEIKLSLAAMEYARHARGDRIDSPAEQLSSYLDRKPQLIERPKLIDALAAAPDKGAYLRALHPKHPQFEALRQKLLELRSAQKDGSDEPEKIPDSPKLNPGKSHPSIAVLRRRLNVKMPETKPNGAPMDESFYDDELAQAVIAYKEHNQIEPANATVNAELRKTLNRRNPIDERMLLANMEEWRWMPEDLGETYVWVNIPEFLVRVKKHDKIIHEERIVSGRVETQTPIFSDKMRTVVFQPSWNVPESIKVNELLPSLRNGGNPIERQGLRLERNGRLVNAWDVDWNRQDIRNYHIYQPPGDANVLGIVKFLFPNKHSVYLHDTPTKRLFNEKVRTFSHGCMRVRNPVQLAEVIMAEDKGWDKEKVNELITTGPEDNDVALDHPIPVHVTYFTAWVDESGDVKTFADVYGHEQRIKLGLEGRWNEIVKNRDHLLPADPGAIATREDWGDQDDDGSRRKQRRGAQRYSLDEESADEPPRGYARGQQIRQGYQKRKSGSAFSDLLNNIFGSN